MQLRITSDGTPGGTRLFDVKSGRAFPLAVRRLAWALDGEKNAGATLEVDLADAQVDGDGKVFLAHPTDGGRRAVARIVFEDGTEWPGL